jgi:hypothetical protein
MINYVGNNIKLNSPLGLHKSFWIWNKNLLNFNNKKITKHLLKKEKEIINKFPSSSDGNTNLPNSLTSRYSHYNFFTYFKNPIKEIKIIKNFIKENIKNLLDEFKIINRKELHILCWYNVLRKGQQIAYHHHYDSFNATESFISGHFCVNTFNTSTFYQDVLKTYDIGIKNEIGQLTLFPSYLPHWSDIHEGENPRISIAFDVYYSKNYANQDFLKKNVIIPLNLT